MELEFWLGLLVFLPLTMLLHGIRHYIVARAFKQDAHITWGIAKSTVTYHCEEDFPLRNRLVISAGGLLGVIAILPLWVITQDTMLAIVMFAYSLGYTAYEVIRRYRKETRTVR